jgi:hypothetical protein
MNNFILHYQKNIKNLYFKRLNFIGKRMIKIIQETIQETIIIQVTQEIIQEIKII